MKKLIPRLILLTAPFLLAVGIELFVLPIDFFTFRVWEALYILQVRGLPPGRFYPDMTLARSEQGDLAPYSAYAVQKDVVWHTDRYGFRKEEREGASYPVVIVGDSGIVGTGLTQTNMLSEVLERRLGCGVYPYAPFVMSKFAADRRFHDAPPTTVILAVMERSVRLRALQLPSPDAFLPERPWKLAIKNNPGVRRSLILLDRFHKQAMLYYFRGRLKSHVLRWMGLSDIEHARVGRLVFLEGESANQAISAEDERTSFATICGYRDYLATRGIRFVFVLVPNKETFYYDVFPHPAKPTLIPILLERLNRAGVETVNLQTPFEEARARGELLYHDDDSHWNVRGVQIAAEEIARVLEKK